MGAPLDAAIAYETEYTTKCFPELNPEQVRLSLLCAGIAPPKIQSVCELGYGRGLNAAIAATLDPLSWFGTDFQKEHYAFAKALVEKTGRSTRLLSDQPFSEFCSRQDLPKFDLIVLHGVWSWISDSDRMIIVSFIDRFLKPGGVVYLSYNAMPGHAGLHPLGNLLREAVNYQRFIGNPQALDVSISFIKEIIASNVGYAGANPNAVRQFLTSLTKSKAYVSHEYLSRAWRPMYFGEVFDAFSCIPDLSFVNHADSLEIDFLETENSVSSDIDTRQAYSTRLRESLRDFQLNRRFRKDYWVRAPRRLCGDERESLICETRVTRVWSSAESQNLVKSCAETQNINSLLARRVIERLAPGAEVSLADLVSEVPSISFREILRLLLYLISTGGIAVVTSDRKRLASRTAGVQNLNDHLLALVANGADIEFLASPITGWGIYVPLIDQLCLAAVRLSTDFSQQVTWINFALASRGLKITKDDGTLSGQHSDTAGYLIDFINQRMPELRRLGCAVC
jgi:SAM-dependent methyltransferase